MSRQPQQMRRNSRIRALIGPTLALSLLCLVPMRGAAGPPLGINLSNDTLFVDATKTSTSGGWYDFGPGETPALPPNPNFGVDANGWPTSDCANNFWDYRVNMPWNGPDPNAVARDLSGTYKMSFNGIAQLQSQSGGLFTVANQVYTTATNTTTLDLTIPAGEETLFLRFINTQRTQASAVNTGLTNIKLIRPGYPTTNGLPNSSTPVFTNYYTRTTDITGTPAMLKDFGSMRCMGLLSINSNKNNYFAGGDAQLPSYYISGSNPPVVNPNRFILWSNRKLPGDAFQTDAGVKYGYSWEYLVQLANLTNKDLWINIPTGASDSYITNVANLLKYGSDGVNPYTSTQANPIWAPLNANLHVYVEYSNEVWNTTLSGAYYYVKDMSNDPAMPPAAQGWVGFAYGYRVMQISNLFKAVYGAGAINTTIRPLIAWQSAQIEQGHSILQQINQYYGAPSQFFYGLASAPYFDEGSGNDAADLTTMFTYLNADISGLKFHQAIQTTTIAKYWGMKSLDYEGGVGLVGWTNANKLLMDDANRDTRMGTAITNYLNMLYGSAGVDLFHQLALVSIPSPGYGFWEIYEDPSKPMVKSNAFDAVASAAAPAVTAGTALPTSTGSPVTIAAGADMLNQYGVYGPGSGGSGIGGSGNYLMYLARNTNAGSATYTISLNSGECCPNSSKMFEILVDNAVVSGPFQIPGNGLNSAAATFTITPGLHSVEVAGTSTSGSTINYLTVNFVSTVSSNLAANPGFETGTFASWAPYGGNSITTGNAHSGTYAATLTTANSGFDQIVSGLTPNTTYVLTAWLKNAVSGDQMYMGAKNFGSAQVVAGTTGTAYTECTITFTTGATNTTADIWGYKQTGTGASYADDYILTH